MADEPQRHRIEVACPECGHLQTEPALVVSTQCRACRANFQVKDGKGVVRTVPITRLATPRSDDDPEPEEEIVPSIQAFQPRMGPASPPSRSFLRRLLYPVKPPRDTTCFHCNHSFTTIAEAQSSQCPKCGSYINLLDVEVTEHWNRRIETGGNVTIQKSGSVVGTTIRCQHLTVFGQLSGSAECSGNIVIRSNGKITGTIHCDNLRVEKGAHIEFMSPVTATTATILGEVRGQISCSGAVILEKRAKLHGLVRTSSLIVKPGARHTGTVEMISTQLI